MCESMDWSITQIWTLRGIHPEVTLGCLLSTTKRGGNALGSVRPSVCPSVCALPDCLCVCNQWAYADNCVDAVDQLLMICV